MIAPKSDSLTGRIVCGTDFSLLAAEAAHAAAAVTMRLKQPLLLVPAPPKNWHDELFESAQDWLGALVREKLSAEAARLRLLGATVEERMLDVLSEKSMTELLRDCGAALVMIGATERELMKRCLVGDAVDALAEWSPISTVLVRAALPFQEWTRGKRPLRVLVACDPAESSEVALGCARELRRVAPCEVTVGYALDDSAEGDSDLAVKGKISALLGDENVDLLVMHGAFDVHRRMLELAQETQPDLLVVGPPQHHDFTPWPHLSVARTVLRHFPLNVICAPMRVAPLRTRTPAPIATAMPASLALAL
ncbi:MAG TPA: universal stress protein [Chthoniobacterales bacterium]|nr:universal stress protein [Chthoniobacterales bacterium]